MSHKILVIAAALTALAIPAAAQEEGKPQDRPVPLRAQVLFNLVDVNADGAIDQTETAALQRAIFAAVDADGDGKITEAEFGMIVASMGPPQGRHGRFMQGGPGRQGMFMHRGGPRHDDGEGMRRGGPDGRQGELMPQDGGIPPMPEGMPMPQLGDMPIPGPDAPQDFASLDTNGDGVVSPEEFAAGAPVIRVLPQ